MSHYPDTVNSNDPKAPWNRSEPQMSEWEACWDGKCFYCDSENLEINDDRVCKECFEPTEIEDEL